MKTDAEIETERLEDIEEDRRNHEDDRIAEATPESLYHYEAMHMSSFFLNSFYEQVAMNPAVLRDPDSYRMASQAHKLMWALYQRLGAQWFEAEEQKLHGEQK